MKLTYKESGKGAPLIVLHGLFGSSDNWQTLAKKFAEHLAVYLIDLRNHGHSPHSEILNYEVMSQDLLEFINDHKLVQPVVLGHSMGGKAAMHLAINHSSKLSRLIIVDVSPRYYPVHHQHILDVLTSVDLDKINSRKEVEQIISEKIQDEGTKQFLLKNLYWKEKVENVDCNHSKRLAWRFNLNVINKQIENVGEEIGNKKKCFLPALFLRGEKSNYVTSEDQKNILNIFPNAVIETIPDAGHWIHADQPVLLFKKVMNFIKF